MGDLASVVRGRRLLSNSAAESNEVVPADQTALVPSSQGGQTAPVVQPPAPVGKPRKATTRKSLVQELLETVLLTVLLFGAAKFSVQNFQVDGVSMVPTLQNNEMILVDKVSYHFHDGLPSRGDIIVFHAPPRTYQVGRDFIKRVIGLPGDVIAVKPVDGVNHVFVNGKMMSEPYIKEAPLDTYPDQCIGRFKTCVGDRVPANSVFVMGDNRNASFDSRMWGYVPKANIIGRALVSYWPLSHLALIQSQFAYAK